MRKIGIKRLVLIVFAAMLVGGFLFKERLLSMWLEHYLQGYLRRSLGAELTVESSRNSANSFVLEKPVLIQAKTGKRVLSADRAVIGYVLNLFDRSIALNVEISAPHLEITQISSSQVSNAQFSYSLPSLPNLGFFRVKGHFQAEQGTLVLNSSTDNQKMDFQLQGDWTPVLNIQAKAWVAGASSGNQIDASLAKTEDGLNIAHITFDNVDCQLAGSALQSLVPSINWVVSSGKLQGKIAIAMGREHKPIFDGELALQEVAFSLPGLSINGNIPSAKLLMTKESQQGRLELLQPAKLVYAPSESESSWQINDILGAFNLDSNYRIEGILDGAYSIGDEIFDFHVVSTFGMDFKPNSFTVLKGWFDAKDFTFKKRLRDIPEEQIHFIGRTHVQGVFDGSCLISYYNIAEASLGKGAYLFRIENSLNDENVFQGVHYLDLGSKEYGGVFELSNASLLDKENELEFTDVSAQMVIKPSRITAIDVEAFCQGIYLAGNLEVDSDRLSTGCLDADIFVHTMSGKISQLQQVVSKCSKPLFFSKCPLDGNIFLRQNGAHLQLNLSPGQTQLNAYVQGSIADGILKSRDADAALQELSLDFQYDHCANTLEISNIQGVLITNPAQDIEEYTFSGDHVRFLDCSSNEAEFDIWLSDKNRDIIRIAGRTRRWIHPASKVGMYVEFLLDTNLSHFGEMHADNFQLILKDWSQVESAHLDLDFNLDTMLKDVQRFNRAGLLFLSPCLSKALNELKVAEGVFNVGIHYDNQTTLLTCQAKGQNVTIGKHSYKNAILNAKKKDNAWIIDQLQLDELSIAADVTSQDNGWKVNFLGLHCGDSVLAGLEGIYFPEQRVFDAKINLLEVDLSKLTEWRGLQHFCAKCRPEGFLKASGTMRLEGKKGRGAWRCEADLNAGIHELKLQGILFDEIENTRCHIVSDRGISLHNIHTGIKSVPQGISLVNFDVEDAYYDFAKHEIALNDFRFNTHAEHLDWVSSRLHELFPTAIHGDIAEGISKIKPSGILEGTLSLRASSHHKSFQALLSRGRYQFSGQEYDLSQLRVEGDPLELRLSGTCLYKTMPLEFVIRSSLPNLESGELRVLNPSDTALSIYWKRDPKLGILLQKIDGGFGGIYMHLIRPEGNQHVSNVLLGKVNVDLQKAVRLLPDDIQPAILEREIDGKYALTGKWDIDFLKSGVWHDQIAFAGTIAGSNCYLNRFQIDKMSAQLDYAPGKISLNAFIMEDISGALSAEAIKITRSHEQKWQMNIPVLTVSQFLPSRLRSADKYWEPSDSTFEIRQLKLEGFSGNLFEPSTFKGTGSADCVNPPKRDVPNPIWNFSSDVLSKMGVDLHVLSPVAGTVHYRVEDEKIYLTKFKDVYSAGKLSKFYLPKNQTKPSYIDFDGNVNVQMRMKQYGLLLKLAELFTVSIQGTLKNPSYSLFKQHHETADEPGNE